MYIYIYIYICIYIYIYIYIYKLRKNGYQIYGAGQLQVSCQCVHFYRFLLTQCLCHPLLNIYSLSMIVSILNL